MGTKFPSTSMILLALTLIFNLQAQQTTFVFKDGRCYEIDTETYGQKFAAKALLSKCRPDKVKFLWVPDENAPDGKCYEVDEETSGQKYQRSALDRDCIPERNYKEWVTLPNGTGLCLIKDAATGGREFLLKTNNSECVSKQAQYSWQPNEANPLMGKCVQTDPNTGASVRADDNKCKPDRTSFLWVPHKKYIGEGNCYEVDANNGALSYSKSVDDRNCLEKSMGFSFDAKSSECVEIGMSNNSQQMKLKAKIENCKSNTTQKIFIKETPIYGVCYEVSSQSSDPAFRRRIATQDCLPTEGQWEYRLVDYNSSEHCLIISKSTSPIDYVESVNIDKCITRTGKFTWSIKADGRSGECKEKIIKGDQVLERNVLDEKCRPTNTYITWHNFGEFDGGCYEVDKDKGPNGFFYKLENKKCKPTITKFVFIKNYGPLGQCFEVDEETGGKKWHNKVSPKPCREKL